MHLRGCEKNKHTDKKCKNKKIAVVGIKDRKTGTVRAIPVPETAAARLLAFIEANVDPNSKKFTDENRTYNVKKDIKHILMSYLPMTYRSVLRDIFVRESAHFFYGIMVNTLW